MYFSFILVIGLGAILASSFMIFAEITSRRVSIFPSAGLHNIYCQHGSDAALARLIDPRGRNVRNDVSVRDYVGGNGLDHRCNSDRPDFACLQVGLWNGKKMGSMMWWLV